MNNNNVLYNHVTNFQKLRLLCARFCVTRLLRNFLVQLLFLHVYYAMADTGVTAEPVSQPPSTYGWLCGNPLASSCGNKLCAIYEGSKNYNGMTKFALGTMESAVTFAAGTAKPLVGRVVEKLDRPSE